MYRGLRKRFVKEGIISLRRRLKLRRCYRSCSEDVAVFGQLILGKNAKYMLGKRQITDRRDAALTTTVATA